MDCTRKCVPTVTPGTRCCRGNGKELKESPWNSLRLKLEAWSITFEYRGPEGVESKVGKHSFRLVGEIGGIDVEVVTFVGRRGCLVEGSP